jgi:nitrogen-specific signal transduction histidine kinase/CheY-like chemotaxis protein
MSQSPVVVEGRRARFATIIDVTERRRLEHQFRQAQKMDAVGRLAGGVAHDFNNLLAVIMSCTEFLVADLPDGDPKLLDVLDIRHAGERAASLTRQLLVFSRKQILQPAPMSLNDLVSEVGKLLKRLIGEDIRFVTVLRPEVGRVMADRGQMEQVLVNLVVNARDAMTSGGSLLVESSNVNLGVDESARVGAVAPGPYVVLTVKDTGCGMDEDTLSKVFEPFFTTKEQGKGTGLGLSTVFGIVRQSQGTITVESRLGQGAVFRVYLPRIDGDVQPSSSPQPAARRSHGAETVLLVEDDEQVRAVVRRILKSRGYQVIEAKDGGAALAAYERDPEGIDIVVTDLVIPGFDGVTIASELQTRTPRVKVLYMSGYTEHTVLRRGVLEAGVNFIQKPFSGEELALMVRKVLDA